jgi:hypothetical protein
MAPGTTRHGANGCRVLVPAGSHGSALSPATSIEEGVQIRAYVTKKYGTPTRV